jgi:hypothetical protein
MLRWKELPQLETIATGTKAIMSESQFEAGRVKFDQRLGPCVGDWYEMKDGGRRRFGRDLGESLQLAADPSGRCFSLDADGNATYNGPLLDQVIQRSPWANRRANTSSIFIFRFKLVPCAKCLARPCGTRWTSKIDERESCINVSRL